MYWIVVSGDRDGVIGTYTFIATATPGPLDIGPASKPVIIMDARETYEVSEKPSRTQLLSNFPNPFNSETTINYELSEASSVRLIVYDLTGQTIRTLAQGYRQPGRYTVIWDGQDEAGRNIASGVYLYRLEIGDRGFVETRRMLLLR